MIAVAQKGALGAGALALFLLFSGAVGLIRHEVASVAFLLTALLTVFGAGALHLATRNRSARLGRLSSYGLLTLFWFGASVIAAIPVDATTSLGFVDAWFEAICALTTTGGGGIHAVADVPRATLVWLLSLQWLGGLLTLIGAVAVLAPAGVGGLPDRISGLPEQGISEGTAFFEDAIETVVPVYAGVTMLCMIALFAAGLDGFNAFGMATAAVSTGGLLPDADGMAAYGTMPVKLVMSFFMLAGGTSILWHRMIATRRFRQAFTQRENVSVVVLVIILGILVSAIRYQTPEGRLSLPVALEDGLFTAVSLVTTTGIELHAGDFTSLPLTVVLLIIFMGGASFSTSGGIKLHRVGAMVLQSLMELNRLVMPHAVRPRQLGRQTVPLQAMKAVWVCFVVATVTLGFLAAAIAPAMPSFDAAYVAAMSAMTNAGPVYGAGWEAGTVWPEWGALPAYAKLLLGTGMVLGRLEIVVVLGLVHAALWRR
ncbi:TrkH family potassium uptake protein [Ancylobacter sp. 6x-1]|uniref:TrkH family potassium uptake protein n=1 Tax=Ancylobacter crimeensis TaxID=2579147 RepID=A0ABT0DCW2_9HYPH|nr:potassium transporter TrkG [Ancylobacter crimeensis]MCK0197802.1 TrkH family potassium uptake protein [Ancylobacter crimeensis]